MEMVKLAGTEFRYKDGEPSVDDYTFSDESLRIFLNALNIPIKYYYRLKEENLELARDTVSFWFSLSSHNMRAMVNSKGIIKQVFDGDTNPITFDIVDSWVSDYVGHKRYHYHCYEDQDAHEARYVYDDDLSIRVIYSDILSFTPKIDALIWDGDFYYIWPIAGRKFRLMNSSLSKFNEQIEEFIDIVAAQVRRDFIAHKDSREAKEVSPAKFVDGLYSDLILAKKHIKEYHLPNGYLSDKNVVKMLIKWVMDGVPKGMTLMELRDIEIALSKYIVTGSFKGV